MTEVTITVDMPGRSVEFSGTDDVMTTSDASNRVRARNLLDRVHAEMRDALTPPPASSDHS